MILGAGEFQIGENIKPLDPKSVASVVYYGKLRYPMLHKATGESLIYSQLYPFKGLNNYTSGIIHHVRLTGVVLRSSIFLLLSKIYNAGVVYISFDVVS